jgi:nucleotide-binding universal stress UspA family protein
MNKMKNKEKELNQSDELVTVAIHTYEKAQILKTILEANDIPAIINSVDLIQPNPEGTFRVRIRKSDLQEALSIIENIDLSYDEKTDEEKIADKGKEIRNEILVPVDFSNSSMKASEFAFRLAKDLNCDIKLMHVFFSPYYPISMPFGESYAVQPPDEELYRDIRGRMEKEMDKWIDKLNEKIAAGELPEISFSPILLEGLPEEEIIIYSKKMRPMAIVMGTRGASQKDIDLIGSVTAEVIEGCKTPVFAIPDQAPPKYLSEMKNLGFLTNFRERELVAFDRMMKFIGKYPIKVYLVHVNKKEDMWNEIKLSGIRNFLEKRYPSLEMDYELIDKADESLEEVIDKFVREKNIDILAMSSSRRNIFARMFNPGLARRMLFHSQTPLLVLK